MLTPTPWTIYDDTPLKIGIKGFDRSQGGSLHVATVIMPENAELIVKAVNNHDALVKALQEARDFLDPDRSPPRINNRELTDKLNAILTAVGSLPTRGCE